MTMEQDQYNFLYSLYSETITATYVTLNIAHVRPISTRRNGEKTYFNMD